MKDKKDIALQVNGFELILQSNEFAVEGLRIFLCQQKNELTD